jgi:hypothetical protein
MMGRLICFWSPGCIPVHKHNWLLKYYSLELIISFFAHSSDCRLWLFLLRYCWLCIYYIGSLLVCSNSSWRGPFLWLLGFRYRWYKVFIINLYWLMLYNISLFLCNEFLNYWPRNLWLEPFNFLAQSKVIWIYLLEIFVLNFCVFSHCKCPLRFIAKQHAWLDFWSYVLQVNFCLRLEFDNIFLLHLLLFDILAFVKYFKCSWS